jgi:hypothetical protein
MGRLGIQWTYDPVKGKWRIDLASANAL